MQLHGGRFTVRNVSPNRMIQLFAAGRSLRTTVAASSSGAAAAEPPPQAPAADLVRWVEASGGSAPGVTVRLDAAGFGLHAAADCGAGATLVTLPARCHLTYDASTDPRLLALIDQVPAELWGAKLALQVVAHRLLGSGSPFAPYINNLPLGVAGLPMFYSGDALGMLQYPPVTEQVKKRCRWLLSFTQQALGPAAGTDADPFDGAAVDANALGWALAVVTSRAFRTRGPNQPAAMLPLIDMCNHSFQPNAKIAPGPGGSMCMLATRELKEGEPVLISYGTLANDFLLMDYGFVIPNNPFETVQLRFDRGLVEAAKAVAGVGATGAPDDPESTELPPLPAWQQKELTALGLAGPGADTEVTVRRAAAGGSGPVDARLLAGVRVLCAPHEAALLGRHGVAALGGWDAPIAPASELAALRTLTGICAIALSQFKGTLEDDAALLAGGSGGDSQQPQQPQPQHLSEDQQLSVRFRMDKKALLLEALAAISGRIKQLAGAAAGAAGGSAAAGVGCGSRPGSKPPKSKQGGKGFGA